MTRKIKAALLVDADNLPIAQAEEALKKLADICNPVIKKAFGDFTKSAKNWSPEFLRKHGFTPEMHFAVSNFKNGADIAMCIAAMDIIHAKSVEAIVLFTSDSDFASLAARIREAGLEVVGVGDAKASAVLQGAFDTFVVVEPAKLTPVKLVLTNPLNAVKAPTPKPKQKIPPSVHAEILKAVANLTENGEPVLLAKVHAAVKEQFPKFNFKALKYASLSKMLGSMNELELVSNNRKVRLAKKGK